MEIAAAFLAHTLGELGHQVRRLGSPDGFGANLIITTISPTWRRVHEAARRAGALERLVYWHHAGGVPDPIGHVLAAPPSIAPQGWPRQVVLPPSSWAAEASGECIGDEILVAGAGPAKGGHVALQVAQLCPELRWYVLQGRSSPEDRAPWQAMPHAELARGMVEPQHFLARARAVLAPTRFEVHPLLLVEAAVRGIPIVCSDLPATRAAAGDSAIYVPVTAPAEQWAQALRAALQQHLPRLRLQLYREIVAGVLQQLAQPERAAA